MGTLWTRGLCGLKGTVWTHVGCVDLGEPCGLGGTLWTQGDPVDSGGLGSGAEHPPGTALPAGSSGLCLALSRPRPGNHGGPAARAGAGAAAAGEGRSHGPRSALPALPGPSPGPFQPKRWRAVLRGAPGPRGKSSGPGSPRRYRRWRGNKGAGGPEAVQTAPRRGHRWPGAAGNTQERAGLPSAHLGAACSEHHALFTSPRPRPVGEGAPPGPARAGTTRHPGWSVLVLLAGGDVGTPRYLEAQEA